MKENLFMNGNQIRLILCVWNRHMHLLYNVVQICPLFVKNLTAVSGIILPNFRSPLDSVLTFSRVRAR